MEHLWPWAFLTPLPVTKIIIDDHDIIGVFSEKSSIFFFGGGGLRHLLHLLGSKSQLILWIIAPKSRKMLDIIFLRKNRATFGGSAICIFWDQNHTCGYYMRVLRENKSSFGGWKNTRYYSCVLRKKAIFLGGEGVLCLYGTLWDQNHTWLSIKKVGEMLDIIGL